ncbi:VOC family protein [Myxococcus sp. K15C18031901]|uniref:VOC family protein n=1 Tax=Myxococcus dinghuensis TaxID=2906761 RepID=UPI0020A7653B|nr:VOC family protein [Myxococcus dinghuensis]MCP3097360.1 VOC family protein [Myxococcus dinghuensis]
MAIQQIRPYIHLDGTAERALRFYERALGARVETLMRFWDGPGMKMAPEHLDRVMHASLRVGEQSFLLADTLPDRPAPVGRQVDILLDFDDAADLVARFQALSEGGTTVMAPHDAFWGATFAILDDAYGVRWLLNCEKKR